MPRARRVAGLMAIVAAVASGSTIAVARITSPLAPPSITVAAPGRIVLLEGASTVPLPPAGSLSLAGLAGPAIANRDATVVRPIGSVAKTMTALVVLEAHPLPESDPGPVLTMSPADVALYQQALAQEGSAVSVGAGQRWSERDLLLALMLPSANNIAETLARWVGGDRSTFVAMLNRRADALGMTNTHFVDPSGYSPQTVSTADDLLLLGRAALANPALAGIASTRTAHLPDGGDVSNLDSLLSTDPGWLGIKTGWTPAAGGCLLFAASHTYVPQAPPLVLVGAVLGQPPLSSADRAHPELGGALEAAKAAVDSGFAGFGAVDAAAVPISVRGTITTAWQASSDVAVGQAGHHYVVVRRGEAISLTVAVLRVLAPIRDAERVGELSGSVGDVTVVWPLLASRAVPGPSWLWHLLHG